MDERGCKEIYKNDTLTVNGDNEYKANILIIDSLENALDTEIVANKINRSQIADLKEKLELSTASRKLYTDTIKSEYTYWFVNYEKKMKDNPDKKHFPLSVDEDLKEALARLISRRSN